MEENLHCVSKCLDPDIGFYYFSSSHDDCYKGERPHFDEIPVKKLQRRVWEQGNTLQHWCLVEQHFQSQVHIQVLLYYARILCNHATLVVEFSDPWKGDGMRVMRCWRMFLLHFHACKRCIGGSKIQFQLKSLPPPLVHNLTWGRFINTHGDLGHNIHCDLHNKHLNWLFKHYNLYGTYNFTEKGSTSTINY